MSCVINYGKDQKEISTGEFLVFAIKRGSGEKYEPEIDSYKITIYEQKSIITAENHTKEGTTLALGEFNGTLFGVKLRPVSSLIFWVYPPLIPSNFSTVLLENLHTDLLWQIISDYSINMKGVPFDWQEVAKRIKEWADDYMSNRKL